MESLYNFTYDQMKELAQDYGWKPFRGHQIFQWLYREGATEIDQMTNLSKDARQLLSQHYTIQPLRLIDRQVAKDGTTKFLLETKDGDTLESVLMVFDYGNSVDIEYDVNNEDTSIVVCDIDSKLKDNDVILSSVTYKGNTAIVTDTVAKGVK